ncbi:MAG: hypothetical protein V3V05_12855 [Pontiella sp.]
MDVGKFKASRGRLMAWIGIPPLLIVSVGLSAYAWAQKADTRLIQNQALSDVLPVFIKAQKDAAELIADLGINEEDKIGSEDQLISFLQEAALRRGFTVDAIQVVRHEKVRGKNVPVLSASVDGSGELAAIQLYINEIKSAQQLLSVSSIQLTQPKKMNVENKTFDAKVVFDLLLLEEVLKTAGGTI